IVLVPEISLTPQMIARFEARFPGRVAVIHSQQRPAERLKTWQAIKRGEVSIVLGPRSAVFAPFSRPALILIDEEHEASYVSSQQVPRYSAVSVARIRQLKNQGMLLLASATPAVEDYARAEAGEFKLFELEERATGVRMPEVELLDLKTDKQLFGQAPISIRGLSELKRCVAAGENAMIFLNRRGYAPLLICSECGQTASCPNCSVHLTYHRKEHRLICHYCGHMQERPARCPFCDGALQELGMGTERICEFLTDYFNPNQILRMDSDTTRSRGAHAEILRRFREGKGMILVGTQMIAKGHDFPNLRFVLIAGVDFMFSMQDLRADERAFQLITQAAGRAGRDSERGRVLVEAYNVDHYALHHALKQDYLAFYKDEIRMRRLLKKAPYYHFLTIVISGRDDEETRKYAADLEASLYKQLESDLAAGKDGHYQRIPLSPAPIHLLNQRYRWQFAIKGNRASELRHLMRSIQFQHRSKNCSIACIMDPA
ncbi:MAG: primosomal protein N', partial [Eubacteriales bacterium]|nr:primosomal protein N' [Eubacteriales bacterium]